MPGTYTYDPAGINAYGKDRMRFELGDVMVEGREQTCALCDEEYGAVIPGNISTARKWNRAKLRCLESIMRKFAYEPDTKVGPLSLGFGARAKMWKEMYDELKNDLKACAASAGGILAQVNNPETGAVTPPYFYAGMMSTEESEGRDI